jgi:serine/threonine-protein kinase
MQCTFDKRFVLLDFGAMKSALATEDSVVDLTRQFVGTTGFAPPEQQQLRPCFASDLYALGMTCLFLLSGRWPQAFPWDKRQRLVLWREVISVSQPFEKFLDRLLAPELLERYRCVADALQGLAQLQSAGGSFQASLTSLGPQYQDLEACLHTQLPQRRYRRPGSS